MKWIQAWTQCHQQQGRVLSVAVVGLLLLAFLSLLTGPREIAPSTVWSALVDFDPTQSAHLLIVHLRIPRALLAIVVGFALGVAGTLMQSMTRNPLADPGILGVNAGATLAIVILIAISGHYDVMASLGAGIVGAGIAGLLVYGLGGLGRRFNPVRVVLAGSALSIVLLALTHVITLNSHEAVFDQFRHWAIGALQGRGYAVLGPVTLVTLGGVLGAWTLNRALDTVVLGSDLGQTLGAAPEQLWRYVAGIIVLLAGSATAAAGPLSFIGLAAPHLARAWVGATHRWLLPYAMLIGAYMVLGGDILGRIIGHPSEISVGVMVAFMGGPCFIVLVRRWKIAAL